MANADFAAETYQIKMASSMETRQLRRPVAEFRSNVLIFCVCHEKSAATADEQSRCQNKISKMIEDVPRKLPRCQKLESRTAESPQMILPV